MNSLELILFTEIFSEKSYRWAVFVKYAVI